jgi:endonuclease/exonuclease/phosphatase family metal-dependent hydrolase
LNLAPPEVAPILAEAGFVLAEHGPTYPADVPRLRLDHVAVDGFVVRRAWVAERAPVSDHRAVVAELAVTPSDRAPSARPPFAQEP